ncbi:Na+/H+ antiporter NhaC family protein [Jiella mangrovi]|uniref:Na+/H+ antiporter NhaC family protein n=1 Tax=Jiella mangrovi TaxID=2821407 RepID=A0ABS4BHZ5_9HYPH|nr:Na+/H+ antiporter NhaC family protein [Jiella mangrovi]MBP0615575.1 Na+/H+ antiporter NhaC family protein [Jiella mangrovi]
MGGIPFEQDVKSNIRPQEPVAIEVGGERYEAAPDTFEANEDGLGFTSTIKDITATGENATLALVAGGQTSQEAEVPIIWGWLSLIPALSAIIIALVTRQVVPSLFLGVALGAWMTYGLSLPGIWYGLLDTIQVYILEALVPPDGSKSHMQVVVFTLMMGGMIGIIYRNGGAHAIADRIASFASNRRRTQLATNGLGFAIFFSTYANSLIVGNTMRPVTDRMRISREKLAYIVDSTAAPLASIAIISTWIGYQLGLIEDSIGAIGFQESAYSIFLNALPYNFYPIVALVFVVSIAAMGRDFGPMLKAERRAAEEGHVTRQAAKVASSDQEGDDETEEGGELWLKEGVTQRSINALLPIAVLIVTVAAGLYVTGEGDTIREIIGSAEGNKALVWAGLLGVLTAGGLTLVQGLMPMKEIVASWFDGLKSVLFVMIILTLAWSLSAMAEDLHTAAYLVSVLGDTIAPQYLPALLFLLSAAVSFAVGTSWGTMGILMPLAIPLIWSLMENGGIADQEHAYILYATVGTILAGSVWGDHCSPISDTTVISSVSAGSDHIDHVRTQIPYALTVGALSIAIGLVPTGFGVPWWITLPLTMLAAVLVVRFVGSVVTSDEAQGEAQAQPAE